MAVRATFDTACHAAWYLNPGIWVLSNASDAWRSVQVYRVSHQMQALDAKIKLRYPTELRLLRPRKLFMGMR